MKTTSRHNFLLISFAQIHICTTHSADVAMEKHGHTSILMRMQNDTIPG